MDIGRRIRALRKEHGLSLEALAEKSSVSLGTLSRLENGKGGAGTFRTHQRIADALGLAITELYRGAEAQEEEAVLVKSQGADADTFVYDEKASTVLLATQVSKKRMLPQMLILQPGGKTAVEQLRAGTERWLFGLAGQVEVTLGEKTYPIHEGATLYFRASLPHQFKNTGKAVARCILVTDPAIL